MILPWVSNFYVLMVLLMIDVKLRHFCAHLRVVSVSTFYIFVFGFDLGILRLDGCWHIWKYCIIDIASLMQLPLVMNPQQPNPTWLYPWQNIFSSFFVAVLPIIDNTGFFQNAFHMNSWLAIDFSQIKGTRRILYVLLFHQRHRLNFINSVWRALHTLDFIFKHHYSQNGR